MQIQYLLGLNSENSQHTRGQTAHHLPTSSSLDFGSFLELETGPQLAKGVVKASDASELRGSYSGEVLGIPSKRPGETFTEEEVTVINSLREAYEDMLPSFDGVPFAPPVENYDPQVEMLRLAKVEMKVQAMEEAGEIDKALDAFIGIHGLKDDLSREQRAELRDRLVNVTKAVLLESEWKDAYLGKRLERIDLRIESLKDYLLGEAKSIRKVDAKDDLPFGDPDLLGFVDDPRWVSFEAPPFALIAKADQMLLDYRSGLKR